MNNFERYLLKRMSELEKTIVKIDKEIKAQEEYSTTADDETIYSSYESRAQLREIESAYRTYKNEKLKEAL